MFKTELYRDLKGRKAKISSINQHYEIYITDSSGKFILSRHTQSFSDAMNVLQTLSPQKEWTRWMSD